MNLLVPKRSSSGRLPATGRSVYQSLGRIVAQPRTLTSVVKAGLLSTMDPPWRTSLYLRLKSTIPTNDARLSATLSSILAIEPSAAVQGKNRKHILEFPESCCRRPARWNRIANPTPSVRSTGKSSKWTAASRPLLEIVVGVEPTQPDMA